MYINTGSFITNTPVPRASWDTLPYNIPQNKWYTSNPYFYIDINGNVKSWNSFSRPVSTLVPGGRYKATPTRTGSYYVQNSLY